MGPDKSKSSKNLKLLQSTIPNYGLPKSKLRVGGNSVCKNSWECLYKGVLHLTCMVSTSTNSTSTNVSATGIKFVLVEFVISKFLLVALY
jgi:hypothetical protein